MSVIMTLIVPGDPQAAERLAQEDPEKTERIMERAKSYWTKLEIGDDYGWDA